MHANHVEAVERRRKRTMLSALVLDVLMRLALNWQIT